MPSTANLVKNLMAWECIGPGEEPTTVALIDGHIATLPCKYLCFYL